MLERGGGRRPAGERRDGREVGVKENLHAGDGFWRKAMLGECDAERRCRMVWRFPPVAFRLCSALGRGDHVGLWGGDGRRLVRRKWLERWEDWRSEVRVGEGGRWPHFG